MIREMKSSIEIVEGDHPGLVGEIVRWHGLYYCAGLGWPARFESLCAEQCGEIAKHLGLRDDVITFSAWRGAEFFAGVVMDGRPGPRAGSRLRFFIATDTARGQGLGTRLMERCIGWSEQRGDPSIWLTTVAGLPASAHLYRKYGFVLVEEQSDTTWGSEHIEQTWMRARS